MYGFDRINDLTGFANGDKFGTEAEVRAYFTVEAQREMFPGEDVDEQNALTEMAEEVIRNRWHMK